MALKVLVIDDDPSAVELMKETLSSLGVEVYACDDSVEALRRVHGERFDGIFLDLLMPKLNGFDLTEAIRHSPWNRHCPVVVISGSDDRSSMKSAFAAGGNFFLRKPVDRRLLQALLHASHGSMLGNRRGFSRVPLAVEVICQTGNSNVTKCTAANISERGLLISCRGEFSLGQQLQLRFGLPGQNTELRTKGVVTRLDDSARAGISFTQIRSTDRQRIRLYVADSMHRNVPGNQPSALRTATQ